MTTIAWRGKKKGKSTYKARWGIERKRKTWHPRREARRLRAAERLLAAK